MHGHWTSGLFAGRRSDILDRVPGVGPININICIRAGQVADPSRSYHCAVGARWGNRFCRPPMQRSSDSSVAKCPVGCAFLTAKQAVRWPFNVNREKRWLFCPGRENFRAMEQVNMASQGHLARRHTVRLLLEEARVALVYLGIFMTFAVVAFVACIAWLLIW